MVPDRHDLIAGLVHVQLSKPKHKQPATARDHKPLPQCLEGFLVAKYPTMQGCTYKQDTQTVTKRRGTQTITTETPIDCWSLNLGHDCPFTGETHNNHVALDIVANSDSGKVISVHLRCFAPDCEGERLDLTSDAVDYDECMRWNERVAYIESTSVYIYTAPDRDPVQISGDHDISNCMARYSSLSLTDWLKHSDCSRYHQIGFFPSLTPTPEQFDPGDYNLFRGFNIPPESAVEGDCAPLIDHIHEILCAGVREHSDFFLNCLAQLLQTPWKRLNTATVLISEEGAGKSIVFQHFLAKILGPQCFLSESRADALFGTYNGCLSGKVCVVAEELLWAGSHRDAGILKDMLTSETLSLNDKYQKRWTEQNFANVFVLTNNSWAIQASMHARRFAASLCCSPAIDSAGARPPRRARTLTSCSPSSRSTLRLPLQP